MLLQEELCKPGCFSAALLSLCLAMCVCLRGSRWKVNPQSSGWPYTTYTVLYLCSLNCHAQKIVGFGECFCRCATERRAGTLMLQSWFPPGHVHLFTLKLVQINTRNLQVAFLPGSLAKCQTHPLPTLRRWWRRCCRGSSSLDWAQWGFIWPHTADDLMGKFASVVLLRLTVRHCQQILASHRCRRPVSPSVTVTSRAPETLYSWWDSWLFRCACYSVMFCD